MLEIRVIRVIRVLKTASRSEGIVNKVRSCDLVRFIRGLSLNHKNHSSDIKSRPHFSRTQAQITPNYSFQTLIVIIKNHQFPNP